LQNGHLELVLHEDPAPSLLLVVLLRVDKTLTAVSQLARRAVSSCCCDVEGGCGVEVRRRFEAAGRSQGSGLWEAGRVAGLALKVNRN
jgi:hypothetical protein